MKNRAGGFVERVARLLERVEYRRADSQSEKQAIYRLRHEAYMRAGTVNLGPSGMFTDPFDEVDNAWLIAVFIDGELASAIRLHVSAHPSAPLPVAPAFPDLIDPHLRAGRTLIDPSRFISRLEYSRAHPEIPYITIRPAFLAGEFFSADFITVACLPEHQGFYRRMFSGQRWEETPRSYPLFNRSMVLIGHDCRSLRDSSYSRYPFYQSIEAERALLFSQSSNATPSMRAIGRAGAALA